MKELTQVPTISKGRTWDSNSDLSDPDGPSTLPGCLRLRMRSEKAGRGDCNEGTLQVAAGPLCTHLTQEFHLPLQPLLRSLLGEYSPLLTLQFGASFNY